MIEFKNVSFSYQGDEAAGVRNINLTIKDGEFVLLCGRSGCGKTTITKLINGLIPHYFRGKLSGEVRIDGKAVKDTPMYELAKKVGSVFQNPRTQFFNVDTDSEISFGNENLSLPQKKLRKRLEQTLDDLHIQGLKERNIFKLSGGEKQKVAFASIYAMNPEIYLPDEPSSNLDLSAIEELKKTLKLLKSMGKTIVVAEHRLFYLMDLADKIVYLEHGKIEGIYTPTEFRLLTKEQRKRMGLRSVSLEEIHPEHVESSKGKEILEVKNLSVSHKKREILKDVSLKACEGEVIGIVGRNGEGKTTFLRTLCGLHKEYKGGIFWESRPQKRKEMQSRAYMIMQDVNYQLFADSVRHECTLGIKKFEEATVESTLKELELYDKKDCHPNTLSGGEKQRLSVAVSMISDKKMLVFDEPTSGLDYDSMHKVAELIQKISKDRVVFIVSHDYELLCRSCSRVICFSEKILKEDVRMNGEKEEKIRSLMGEK